MMVLGLTGGVGSGKSTVAQLLRQYGSKVVSLDDLATKLLGAGSPVVCEIAARWPDVMRGSELDRQALASLIFSSPEAREEVNGIVHPRAWEAADKALIDLEESGARVAVVESALLLGSIREKSYDANIVVTADESKRIERLIQFRAMSGQDARARINSQVSQKELEKIADYTVDNSGSYEELKLSVQVMWEEWITPLAERINANKLSWVKRANLEL